MKFNNNKKIYYMYKTTYRTICFYIERLNFDIEYNTPFYFSRSALMLYNYTFEFDGYIECLYDLRFVSDAEYNMFYEFTKAIREECTEIRESIYNE